MGDKMHSHNSNCIYSIAKSNGDSMEFSLSIAEQRVVGFIPAWSLASLHMAMKTRGKGTMNSGLQGSEGKLGNTHPYQVT